MEGLLLVQRPGGPGSIGFNIDPSTVDFEAVPDRRKP